MVRSARRGHRRVRQTDAQAKAPTSSLGAEGRAPALAFTEISPGRETAFTFRKVSLWPLKRLKMVRSARRGHPRVRQTDAQAMAPTSALGAEGRAPALAFTEILPGRETHFTLTKLRKLRRGLAPKNFESKVGQYNNTFHFE